MTRKRIFHVTFFRMKSFASRKSDFFLPLAIHLIRINSRDTHALRFVARNAFLYGFAQSIRSSLFFVRAAFAVLSRFDMVSFTIISPGRARQYNRSWPWVWNLIISQVAVARVILRYIAQHCATLHQCTIAETWREDILSCPHSISCKYTAKELGPWDFVC